MLADGVEHRAVLQAIRHDEIGDGGQAQRALQPGTRVLELGRELRRGQRRQVWVCQRVAGDVIAVGDERLGLRQRHVAAPSFVDGQGDETVGGGDVPRVEFGAGQRELRGPAVVQGDGDHPLGEGRRGERGRRQRQEEQRDEPSKHPVRTGHGFPPPRRVSLVRHDEFDTRRNGRRATGQAPWASNLELADAPRRHQGGARDSNRGAPCSSGPP